MQAGRPEEEWTPVDPPDLSDDYLVVELQPGGRMHTASAIPVQPHGEEQPHPQQEEQEELHHLHQEEQVHLQQEGQERPQEQEELEQLQ